MCGKRVCLVFVVCVVCLCELVLCDVCVCVFARALCASPLCVTHTVLADIFTVISDDSQPYQFEIVTGARQSRKCHAVR